MQHTMQAKLKQLFQYLHERPHWVYAALLILLLLDRYNVFLQFSSVYTDSDQALLWQVARDLMHGDWHQPCFYGQSYNPIVEPLLALPLLYLGVDFQIALPLVTLLLSLFPFVLISTYLYKRVSRLMGMLPLVLALCLSIEYEMLSTIPRGFMAGLAAAVPGILLLLFHKTFKSRIAGGLLIGLSLYLNPNGLLLLPILLLRWPKTRTEFLPLLIPTTLGFVLGLIPQIWNNYFYSQHPELLIHPVNNLSMSAGNFARVVGKLDMYFDFVTPVLWRAGWLSLLLFIWTARVLAKRKAYLQFATVLILFVGILLSLSVAKVEDASNSVFFSGARFYLAYPFMLIYLLYCLIGQRYQSKAWLSTFLLAVSLSFAFFKSNNMNMLISHALRGSAMTVVQISDMQQLEEQCESMLRYSDEKPDLMLGTLGHGGEQLWAYACPCLIDSFPATYIPSYERRTWLHAHFDTISLAKVMLTGITEEQFHSLENVGIPILKQDTGLAWTLIDLQGQTVNSILPISD